jgi:hypothetical protein
MLPKEFKKYFWDCKFEELEWDNYKVFITERLLNFGDMDAVKWLKTRLSGNEILEIVNTSRNIDAKTRNFWNIIYAG